MRKQTVDIIENLVKELKPFLVVDSISVVSGNYLIQTNCTWWLSIKDSIDLGGTIYTIEDFTINESILLSGAIPPNVGSYELPVHDSCLYRNNR